ncbi:MAG: Rieske (2Fe-2S) protein [Gammaproteobacteria bacterium]|nr:Rieske (2Fe-2S) protein [Gammaproteobacteria bacterium]NNL50646.1 Rieske (2Fe-2S) protein [Woeseiaceae bacterium]
MTPSRWHDLCQYDELPDGGARGFDPLVEGRDALFIVRRGDLLNAYRNRCPHQGASLPWRKNAYLNANGTRIVCGAHGARFDIDTGLCTKGPAIGHSLEPVQLNVDKDGNVRAKLHDGS